MKERGNFWDLNSFWTLGKTKPVGVKRAKPVLTIVGSEPKPKRFTPTPAFMIPKEPA